MRYVKIVDQRQRGCCECIDTERKFYKLKNGKMNVRLHCIHDKCPYHELDDVKTYSEYLKKYGNDTVTVLLRALLKNEEKECDFL